MGVDYGRGLVNINMETGIRYGVLPAHDVEWWSDKSEPEYEFDCPFCGEHFGPNFRDICPTCKMPIHDEDYPDQEPNAYVFVEDGYHVTQDCADTDLFIMLSPVYTVCNFCSPCAPGAGDLRSHGTDCKAYCLGHEWFENGAPYNVYSVETNEIVPLYQTKGGNNDNPV